MYLKIAAANSARVLQLFVLSNSFCIRPQKDSIGALSYPSPIASGSLDVVGGATFMLATRAGDLILAAVVTALYPAFTVLLARFVLHERMERHQLFGLLGAGAAVLLLATS